MARRSRSPSAAASPCGAWCSRRARRRRGWTRHSARAAAGPTRFPGCRGARSGSRARRTARGRGACTRSRRRPSRAPPPTARGTAMSSTPAAHHGSRSATRSSALRARGLRASSASPGGVLRPMSFRRGRAPAGTTGRSLERRIDLRLALHEALHGAVLEGVEADARPGVRPGASTSSAACKSALELPELIVDEHAQRLKSARRGMLARLAACARRARPGPRARRCGSRARSRRARDDGLRHAPREALLAEGGDHLANLIDARPSEPGRDGLAARRVHAHIERAVGTEAEAAPRIIELR